MSPQGQKELDVCRRFAQAYLGGNGYFRIAFLSPPWIYWSLEKTVVGLRPSFSAQVRHGEGPPSSSSGALR
jgi:hypothetical protein